MYSSHQSPTVSPNGRVANRESSTQLKIKLPLKTNFLVDEYNLIKQLPWYIKPNINSVVSGRVKNMTLEL